MINKIVFYLGFICIIWLSFKPTPLTPKELVALISICYIGILIKIQELRTDFLEHTKDDLNDYIQELKNGKKN